MNDPIEKIIINNEDEAWDILEKALHKEIGDSAQISFNGWPVFNLTIEGKDFHGSIPTRIMPPILDLQKEIHRIYCRAKYNNENTNKLTHEERSALELVVKIKPGSTQFITDIYRALNEIIGNSNMSGTQVLILLITISTLIATSIGWKNWLSAKEKETGLESTILHSQEETKRMKIFSDAVSKTPELEQNRNAISNIKSDLSKKLKPTDRLNINNEPIINGEYAREILSATKEIPRAVRMDGTYRINDVKFPKEYGGRYRFSVTRLKDERTFIVDAAPDILTQEQISILKESGFGVKSVNLGINAKESRGHIIEANILSIEW